MDMLRYIKVSVGSARVLLSSTAFANVRKTQLRCISVSASYSAPEKGEFYSYKEGPSRLLVGTAVVISSGLSLIWYQRRKNRKHTDQHTLPLQLSASSDKPSSDGSSKTSEDSKVSNRERRYKEFSSLYFKGEPYMTPRDFLESVTLQKPRCK